MRKDTTGYVTRILGMGGETVGQVSKEQTRTGNSTEGRGDGTPALWSHTGYIQHVSPPRSPGADDQPAHDSRHCYLKVYGSDKDSFKDTHQ